MQRSFVSLIVAAVLLVAGVATYAWAQTQTVLVTPALQLGTPTGDEDFGALCMATNVTLEARRIQLMLFDGQGVRTRPLPSPTPQAGATPVPSPTAIGAFQTAILSDPGYDTPGSNAAGLRYCVIIVDGEATDVRSSMCVTDLASGRCVTVVEGR